MAEQSRDIYQANLGKAGFGTITTEILPVRNYNRAEEKPSGLSAEKTLQGYCGLGGTGVAFGKGVNPQATPALDAST